MQVTPADRMGAMGSTIHNGGINGNSNIVISSSIIIINGVT